MEVPASEARSLCQNGRGIIVRSSSWERNTSNQPFAQAEPEVGQEIQICTIQFIAKDSLPITAVPAHDWLKRPVGRKTHYDVQSAVAILSGAARQPEIGHDTK